MVFPRLRPDKLRAILLTGSPGVGKTTTIGRLVEHFSDRGKRIEGFTTREVLESGVRVGFRITDIRALGMKAGSRTKISKRVRGLAPTMLTQMI